MSAATPLRAIGPATPFADSVRAVLEAQLAEVFVWSGFLAQADRPREHHLMRIAAKRLRYSLDIFRPLVPEVAETVIPPLRAIQNELGALHDLDELFVSIEDAMMAAPTLPGKQRHEMVRARAAQQRTSLEALLSAVAAQRDAQHQRCLARWNDLEGLAAFAPLRALLRGPAIGDAETPLP